MSSAETAPFGAVFVSAWGDPRLDAVASLRPSLCVRYSFSGLGSRRSMTSSGASASRGRPRSLGSVVLGHGPWAVVRAALFAVSTPGPWPVSCGASAFERGPWASMRLPRYWVELGGLGRVLPRYWAVGRGSRVVELGPWAVGFLAWSRDHGPWPAPKKPPLV